MSCYLFLQPGRRVYWLFRDVVCSFPNFFQLLKELFTGSYFYRLIFVMERLLKGFSFILWKKLTLRARCVLRSTRYCWVFLGMWEWEWLGETLLGVVEHNFGRSWVVWICIGMPMFANWVELNSVIRSDLYLVCSVFILSLGRGELSSTKKRGKTEAC